MCPSTQRGSAPRHEVSLCTRYALTGPSLPNVFAAYLHWWVQARAKRVCQCELTVCFGESLRTRDGSFGMLRCARALIALVGTRRELRPNKASAFRCKAILLIGAVSRWAEKCQEAGCRCNGQPRSSQTFRLPGESGYEGLPCLWV